jgi:hypothetical protein
MHFISLQRSAFHVHRLTGAIFAEHPTICPQSPSVGPPVAHLPPRKKRPFFKEYAAFCPLNPPRRPPRPTARKKTAKSLPVQFLTHVLPNSYIHLWPAYPARAKVAPTWHAAPEPAPSRPPPPPKKALSDGFHGSSPRAGEPVDSPPTNLRKTAPHFHGFTVRPLPSCPTPC